MSMNLITKTIMMNMDVKRLLFVVLTFVGLLGVAQNGTKNTFTVEGGMGASAYKWETSQDFGTTIAASWDFNLMTGYYFHDRVNVNLEYERHTYLSGNNDSAEFQTDYIGVNRLGIGLRFAVIDNPKYQMTLGGTVGGFNFGYNVSDSSSTASVSARGIYQTYGITNKFYFGKQRNWGIFLKAGFVNNPMTLDQVTINGETSDEFLGKPVEEYKFNSIGYYLRFGFTVDIKGKTDKEL